jgi:tetratricopeptide (TPR) repeat protein
MKKILLAVLALVLLAGAAFLIRQNLPTKRYARHLVKARLFVREKNYTAARLEYEQAFNATDGFTPYASLEVLNFTNQLNQQEGKLPEALANTKKYLELHPESKDGKLILAQLAFQLGEAETAFEAIRSVLDQDPNYFPGRLLLTQVRTKQGRLDLAEEQLRYLYKAYPESVTTLLPLAENMLRQGRVGEARGFVQAALKDHPNNNNARVMLLDSYLMDGKADSAQAALDEWLQRDSSLVLPVRIRQAQIQAMTGKFAEAEATLTPFLEDREENAPAFFEMALIKAKQEEYDSAITFYIKMSELNAANAAQPLMLTIYLNFKNGNPAKALETLKTLMIKNKGGELPTLMGIAFLALGQDNKLTALIDEQPDSLKAGFQTFIDQMQRDKEFVGQWALVNYYTILRQPRFASGAIEALYKRWPKNKLAMTLWSSQLAALNRYAEAAKLLEQVPDRNFQQQVTLVGFYVRAKMDGKIVPLAQELLSGHPKAKGLNLFLGDYWMGHGDKPKALAYYEAELAIEPDNIVALNNLAWEYGITQGNLEKAKPYVEKLKAKKMLDPRILDTIGWVLARNGQGAEAERYFQTALNMIPDHPSFQYHYSFVLSQLGKKEESRKYLQASLASKLPFDERKDAEKLLAQGG